MRRRDFITLLGSSAVAWPLTARAQQPVMPVIGWLGDSSATAMASRLDAFRQGLKEGGFVEGQNVSIVYRWAHNDNNRLRDLASDLARQRVTIIVAGAGTPAALAAKAATSTISIVFQTGADPIRAGLVTSLNRPGGNVTGIAGFTDVLITKRLELLTELVPSAGTFGALLNGNNPNSQNRSRDLQAAARQIKRDMRILNVGSRNELEKAFAAATQERLGGLVVQNDFLFISNSEQLTSLATRFQVPTIYENRDFVEAGGLISYGAVYRHSYHLLGSYTSRILKGERPGDLPVLEPTTFELVINLKAAKALGLTISPTLLARANEVIE